MIALCKSAKELRPHGVAIPYCVMMVFDKNRIADISCRVLVFQNFNTVHAFAQDMHTS